MLVAERCMAIVLLFYLKWVSVTASGVGPCPKLESTALPVNLSLVSGHWFEIERSFYLMELISGCVTLDIKQTGKSRLEVVVNSRSTWSGSLSISEGIAVPARRDGSIFLYRVNSKLPRLIHRYLPGTGLYQVLKTDYDNYAIIYSCSNYQLVHIDMLWIWSRKKEISAKLRSHLYAFLATNNFDSERLILSKHENCTEDSFDDADDYF